MKVGVLFYVTSYTVDPVTVGRAVEEAGFDSFWVPEHGVLPDDPTIAYPMTGGAVPAVYGQMADPFVLLSFIAAATSTIKLGTCVCIVPEHHPLRLAKAVGTLDSFSGGRMLFGVGTGWMRQEIEAFGTNFDTRWRYTRESLEAMKGLWADGAAAYDGQLVKFASVICDPKPAQKPHPPILLGAQRSDATFKRIATMADGWIAMGVSPDDLVAARGSIAQQCEAIGRDPAEIEISVGVRDASPDVQRAFEDAGADRLIVSLYNHPGEQIPMERWGEAALRSHTGGVPTPAETLHAVERVATIAGL